MEMAAEKLCLALFVMVALGKAYAVDLPEFIHVCKRNDPQLTTCIKESGEFLRPYLVTGVPEYDIPSLEPLVMEDLIEEDAGGLHLTATHVRAFGCSKYNIKSVNVDLETQTWDLGIDFDRLDIEANYQVNGKILVLNVRGEGPMYANLTDITSKAHVEGELFEEGGEQHLKFVTMTVETNVGGGVARIDGLFNGDKMLNDVINETFNKNIKLFIAELMPIISKSLAKEFLHISNRIVEQFTYDQLFPE